MNAISTTRNGATIMTRLAAAQPVASDATKADKTIQFVFANPGPVRGDPHELKVGAWVANWKGMQRDGTTNFRRNPIVIESHNYESRGVGKVTSITELPDGRLTGTVQFADTEDGNELYELYRSGTMGACSIGYAVESATRSTDPARGYGALDILRAELIELSLCAVGADENALVLGRAAKSAKKPDDKARVYAAAREAMTFKSLGEHLRAIADFHATWQLDPRLQRAPLGHGEIDPSGGGFLVAPVLADTFIESLYRESVLLPLCDVRETANGLAETKIAAIDETSRANGSRVGGSLSYWLAEAATISPSMPKYRQISFNPKKLAAVTYLSNELLEDSPMAEAALRSATISEFGFRIDEALLVGSGAGQPLGILNAPCKVQISKENGQAAATVTATNLRKMWSALPGPSRERAVWIMGEQVEEQLDQTAGGLSELYLPRGANGNDRPLLKGRPVYYVEAASALGTEGDIILADMSQMIAVHGGLKTALSMDLRFVNDEAVARFTWRIDASPAFASSITAFNVSGQKSPFVTLQTRS